MDDTRTVAAALHAALETGDVTAFAGRLADGAIVWHNSDRLELSKDASLARLAGVAQVASDVRVEVVRFAETDFGFVEQIVLRGTVRATGNTIELHNCLVVGVTDGLVTRIDEYVDPQVASQAGR